MSNNEKENRNKEWVKIVEESTIKSESNDDLKKDFEGIEVTWVRRKC